MCNVLGRFILQECRAVYDTVLVTSLARACVKLPLNDALLVFLLQQLLGADCLRIVDIVVLQRAVHGSSAVRDWYLRSVYLARLLDRYPQLYVGADKRVLYPDSVLVMDSQRVIPQLGMSFILPHRGNYSHVRGGVIWLLYYFVLGRP
jgi:hypothetical protein